MGLIKCNIHGLSGIYELCHHYRRRDYRANQKIKWQCLPGVNVLLCDACYIKYNVQGLRISNNLTFDEMLDLEEEKIKGIFDIYDQIDRKVECYKCLKESINYF